MLSSRKLISSSEEILSIHTTLTAGDAGKLITIKIFLKYIFQGGAYRRCQGDRWRSLLSPLPRYYGNSYMWCMSSTYWRKSYQCSWKTMACGGQFFRILFYWINCLFQHFVCAVCEKPFLGNRHYERKGLAYCEQHFHKLYGNICFRCSQPCGSEVFQALQKTWCTKCFSCSLCDKKMDQKTKFYEFDMKPTCKRCYDRFPTELKKRISDNLKERDPETLRRRSQSPARKPPPQQ